jgi:CRISPR/Cas system-associated exonuclease Cas4 (RecB family)
MSTVLEFRRGAATAAPSSEQMGLADVLSPSQVSTFLACPAKWCFKFLLDLRETKTSSLAMGNAVHSPITTALDWKRASGKDVEIGAVDELFEQAWAEETDQAEFRDDEEPTKLHDQARAMVRKYMTEAAPFIKPAAVELPISGEIGGVRIRGRLDILEEDGCVIDIKTAAKSPGDEMTTDHRAQLATYCLLCPKASGKARRDTITKTKVVQIVPQPIEIGQPDVVYLEGIYPQAQEAMRDGVFYPRRDSTMCSRKYCAFWRDCENEYGGVVKGRVKE